MEDFSIKGVILYTDKGVRLITSDDTQLITKHGCFHYCNMNRNDFNNKQKANCLIVKSILLNSHEIGEKDWYKDENNFRNYNGQLKHM